MTNIKLYDCFDIEYNDLVQVIKHEDYLHIYCSNQEEIDYLRGLFLVVGKPHKASIYTGRAREDLKQMMMVNPDIITTIAPIQYKRPKNTFEERTKAIFKRGF